MRIFIAGATGVLGRRVVRQLIEKGHQVVGLSRSVQNTIWLSGQGALPRQGSLFNPEQLIEISADCDATLHLATAIPTKSRTTAKDWAMNDRIRREGTQNLVQAALENKHAFFLQESFTLLYGDQRGGWVDEDADLPESQIEPLKSAVDMEGIVHRAQHEGLAAIILRFGRFYSYDSAHTQSLFQMTKKGLFPIIGRGEYYWHLIHVDDAAGAVVKAVDSHRECADMIFNICDDVPVLFSTYLEYVAERLKANQPFRIPEWMARLMLGASTVAALKISLRCRSERFRSATGWEPEYLSYCDGIPSEIEKWQSLNGS
jgi:nucleoside-diphosphate-sugar epimerase